MRKETVPFGEWKFGVDCAENGDKVVLESSNGTFSCVDTVLFRRNTLELDVVFTKRIFEVLGAFVVENV